MPSGGHSKNSRFLICPGGQEFALIPLLLLPPPDGIGTNRTENTCVDDSLKNELTDQCAKDIFTELEDGIYKDDLLNPEMQVELDLSESVNLNFHETILSMFNQSGEYDFKIINGTTQNPQANGQTSPIARYNSQIKRYEITTTLNDNYLAHATQLAIARTIIHEMVHAYLVYKYKADPIGSIHEGLDRLYAQNQGNIQITHHEFMAQFIDAMAYSLYEWDKEHGTGGQLDWDYYEALAFSGQFQVYPNGNLASSSNAFLQLVPNANDRQDIADINMNEQKNNGDAQGTDCK
jgi:hypothetical protein